MAKRGFLRLKISTDCPYFTILIVSLFYVVRSYFIWSFAPRCRLLLWWKLLLTAGDISPTYNHFWAYPVFCLGRERLCFSTRYPYWTERPPAAQFQIFRAEKLSPSGRVARKLRERSPFFINRRWKCPRSAEHTISFRLNWGQCHRRDLLLLRFP